MLLNLNLNYCAFPRVALASGTGTMHLALKELGARPGIEFMPEADYGRANRWLSVILITPEQFGADREAVRLALEAENIESRPVWKPMHLQPVFQTTHPCRVVGGSVSEDLFTRGLCLPRQPIPSRCRPGHIPSKRHVFEPAAGKAGNRSLHGCRKTHTDS